MTGSRVRWPARSGRSPNLPGTVRPVILSAGLQALAMSGFSAYVGIWAIQRLHAGPEALGVALFLRAGLGVVTGYVGGRLSDRLGRRPVALASWTSQTVCVACFALVGRSVAAGLALVVAFGPLGPPGSAAVAGYVADAVPGRQRAVAFAELRAVRSTASVLGPPLAALLLLNRHWTSLFAGLAAASAIAVLIAWKLLPRSRPQTDGTRRTDAGAKRSSMWRNRQFLLFLASATLVTLTLAATDRFLPIAAVSSYHLPASTWGVVVALNPLLIILFQRPVTMRSEKLPRLAPMVIGAFLIGPPFLLLAANSGAASIVAVVILSTAGEMLWLPTAQAVVADLAPDDERGGYLGAFDGSTSLAYALGPMAALTLGAAAGEDSVWYSFAGLAAVGAALGAAPARHLIAEGGQAPE